MSITFNAKVYSPDSYAVNSVGYIGVAKTASVKDDFLLSRSQPKPTTDFSGLSRTAAKLTRTVTLTGALSPTADTKVQVLVDVPVGMASADIDSLLNDVGALVSGADMKTHVKQQKITY